MSRYAERKIKFELIELVKREEALWNPLCPGYKSRNKVKIWLKLSKILKCNAKEMWKGLRNQLTRELRIGKASRSRDHQGDQTKTYTGTWPFFEVLQFLLPTSRTLPNPSNKDQSFNPKPKPPTLEDLINYIDDFSDHSNSFDLSENSATDLRTTTSPPSQLTLNSSCKIYKAKLTQNQNDFSSDSLPWDILHYVPSEAPNENCGTDPRMTTPPTSETFIINSSCETSEAQLSQCPTNDPSFHNVENLSWDIPDQVTSDAPNENSGADPHTISPPASQNESELTGNLKYDDPDVLFVRSLLSDIRRAKFKPRLKSKIWMVMNEHFKEEEMSALDVNTVNIHSLTSE